ncbi:MAG: hypothetical protein JWO98_552 [Frankiales bacterium]|nr:hypothetical protein [Frankiales bacterium]
MGVVSKIVAALSRAQSEVERLELEVARWEGDARTKREELAALEASVGDVVMTDETGTAARELAVTAMELRFLIDGAHAAARAAERKLRDARWALMGAQAAELRERSGKVRVEAEGRQAKVDELRAALVEFEGGDWRPWDPPSGSYGMVVPPPLKTPQMFAEADRLDREASALEEQVAVERQRASVRIPTARIDWRPSHSSGQSSAAFSCSVTEGLGSVVFELTKDGHPIGAVTLPDDRGNLGSRDLVDLGGFGELLEVHCAGEVLASLRTEKLTLGPPMPASGPLLAATA